jgi:hypothetical protein
MEGYPNWADSGCGCLTVFSLIIGLALVAGIVLLHGATV